MSPGTQPIALRIGDAMISFCMHNSSPVIQHDPWGQRDLVLLNMHACLYVSTTEDVSVDHIYEHKIFIYLHFSKEIKSKATYRPIRKLYMEIHLKHHDSIIKG
jgi:hypothetical protein